MEPENEKPMLLRLEWWFWVCVWFLATGVIASSVSKLPGDFVKASLIVGLLLAACYFVVMAILKRRFRKGIRTRFNSLL